MKDPDLQKFMEEQLRKDAEWWARMEKEEEEWRTKMRQQREEWQREYGRKRRRHNVIMALLSLIVYPLAAWLGVYIAYRFLP